MDKGSNKRDCGSECRGFESHRAPFLISVSYVLAEIFLYLFYWFSPRLIASLTCDMLLRETGSDSRQCLMSSWVEPE